jgi:GTPase SAR1 family protein
MIVNKKIIFVGPPGTGKTTIKKIFFDMVNPVQLLKSSLKPSRGINSSVYSTSDFEIGIFDLAGQENQNWFNKDKEIFYQSNLIICVLDINSYVKDNFKFIEKIIVILKDLNLNDCHIVIFLHKIDLIDPLYVNYKFKTVDDYIKNELEVKSGVQTFTTSILKKYFFDTYDIISNLLFTYLIPQSIFKNDKIINEFKISINILLKLDDNKKYRVLDLYHNMNLNVKDASIHLKRLEKLGFINFFGSTQSFQLTEKVKFFKPELKKFDLNKQERKINKILESLYFFSSLK